MKKIAAILLAAGLLLTVLPFGAAAYGAEDNKMIITHINTAGSTEGSAIVISGTETSTVGTKGSFAWWDVVIFDWDVNDSCFKVKEVNTKNGGSYSKSDMKIPKYGFAYCICVGNDYSSSGGINYVTQRIKDSKALVKTLKVGDKAYLYNTHLSAGQIKTNGKEWYAPDFTSDSFVKLFNPESGLVGYDPVKAENEAAQLRIDINHVNSLHYATGDCNLFLSSYGKYVEKDYSWWSCLVFAWDQSENSYVCVAADQAVASGNTKTPPIPENGFVVLDCSSGSKTAVAACAVGTKAWLYKDASDNYTVMLNLPEETMTPVVPAGSAQEKTPVFGNLPASGVSAKCTPDGMTIEWEGDASEYLLSINYSVPNQLNSLTLKPVKVSGKSYTIPKNLLKVGSAYTVMLTAIGTDKLSSVPAVAKLYCVSEEALNSSLSQKTVVAFGDSLTARSGWVSMIGGFIGTEVINSGVGGDSTRNAVARLQEDVLDKNPDIVLICFAMNDQAQVISSKTPNVPLNTYIANMEKCVEAIRGIGAEVIFIAPHDAYNGAGYYVPGNYGLDYSYGNMKLFCDAIRQMALKYGCNFIDIYTETETEDMSKFLNAGDGIHQSLYGHQMWAKYVSNLLLAAYDDINSAEIKVVCKDENGKELDNYAFTAAVGSSLVVPAKEIKGYKLLDSEKKITPSGDTEIVYTYKDESTVSGDINGDNKLDAFDYMMVKTKVLGTYNATPEQTAKMDVNHDGIVNAFDYQMIKAAVLGSLTLS